MEVKAVYSQLPLRYRKEMKAITDQAQNNKELFFNKNPHPHTLKPYVCKMQIPFVKLPRRDLESIHSG